MEAMVTMSGVSLPMPNGALGEWLLKAMHARPMKDVRAERQMLEAEKVRQEVERQALAARPIVIDTRDLVLVRLEKANTRNDVRYLKTYDKSGTERWFEKARCTELQDTGSEYMVRMPRAAVKARKMEYAIVEEVA